MAPRDVVTDHCTKWPTEDDECYVPRTPADAHDDWVTAALYQMAAQERYLKVVIEDVESICEEYARVLLAPRVQWDADEVAAMESEIKTHRNKLDKFRRVHASLEKQVGSLRRLQERFHTQQIGYEEYVETSLALAKASKAP